MFIGKILLLIRILVWFFSFLDESFLYFYVCSILLWFLLGILVWYCLFIILQFCLQSFLCFLVFFWLFGVISSRIFFLLRLSFVLVVLQSLSNQNILSYFSFFYNLLIDCFIQNFSIVYHFSSTLLSSSYSFWFSSNDHLNFSLLICLFAFLSIFLFWLILLNLILFLQ